MGGTLYDYRTLAGAERESLVALVRWLGIEAGEQEVLDAYRCSMREVFRRYLLRPFYLHRDLFREALEGMVRSFGRRLDEARARRYEELKWIGYQRDSALRGGVVETLVALRARGLRLGIVSNIDEEQLRRMVALGRLERHFDWVLSSEAARSCKPHGGIFRLALEKAGCQASEALFVGDAIAQDIEGANRAGIRSVLFWYRDGSDPPASDSAPHCVIRRIADVLDLVGR